MTRPIENFVEVETQGNFSLWIDRPIYQIYKTTCGYVRNTRTGENMGTTVELHMNLYDDEYNKLDVNFGLDNSRKNLVVNHIVYTVKSCIFFVVQKISYLVLVERTTSGL